MPSANLNLHVAARRGRAAAIALASTGLISGVGLITALFLIRAMDKSDFGAYGVGIALGMMLGGILNDLIGIPFALELEKVQRSERAPFTAVAVITVVVFGMILCIAALVIQFILHAAIGIGGAPAFTASVMMAGTAFAAQEVLCKAAYSQGKGGIALVRSLVFALVFPLSLVMYHVWLQPLSSTAALLLYFFGMATAGSVAWGLLRLTLARGRREREILKRAILSCGLSQVLVGAANLGRTQGPVLLAGLLGGAIAAAEISAARLLMTPAITLLPPVGYLAMPSLGRLVRQGVGPVFRRSLQIAVGLTLGAFLYCVVIGIWFDEAVVLALGREYDHIGVIVVAWGLALLGLPHRTIGTIMLQVLGLTRKLMILAVGSFGLFVLLFVISFRFAGGASGVWALAASELTLGAAVFWVAWRMRQFEGPRTNAS